MDEPTSALDFGNQVRVLDCMSDLAAHGVAIVMTTDAPDQALRISHPTARMQDGRIIACGATPDVVAGGALSELHGIPLHVVESRLAAGRVARTCLPLRSIAGRARRRSKVDDEHVVETPWSQTINRPGPVPSSANTPK